MNADSTFQIGKDHIVCEDYALSGVSGVVDSTAYAIVCDGCSASPDVDFGARALAMSAKRALAMCTDYSPDVFGEKSIFNANKVFDVFPLLHPQALDATLLAAWVYDKKLYAYLYGDGVYIHKHKNGIWVNHIELTSGSPDYLSYHLDERRMKEYMKIEDNQKEIIYRRDDGVYDKTFGKPFVPVVIKTDVDEGDIIAVISDGMNSFRRQDNSSIDFKDLIDEFIGFKTTEGQFVQRRINAFKRKCLKENITHSDDISIAAIVI